MTYKAPVSDQQFVLKDVLGYESLTNLPRFADAPLDVTEQILTEGARYCEEVLAPLNGIGDKQGCHWADGVVTTPKGFKEAYRQMFEGGWCALAARPEDGGQGLPALLALAYSEMSSSANMAFSMYPGLTRGNYEAILEGAA